LRRSVLSRTTSCSLIESRRIAENSAKYSLLSLYFSFTYEMTFSLLTPVVVCPRYRLDDLDYALDGISPSQSLSTRRSNMLIVIDMLKENNISSLLRYSHTWLSSYINIVVTRSKGLLPDVFERFKPYFGIEIEEVNSMPPFFLYESLVTTYQRYRLGLYRIRS